MDHGSGLEVVALTADHVQKVEEDEEKDRKSHRHSVDHLISSGESEMKMSKFKVMLLIRRTKDKYLITKKT